MRIMHIKPTIKNWFDRFKDFVFFKSTKRSRISKIIIEVVPLNNSGCKNEFPKYLCLTLNKGMLLWFLVIRGDKALGKYQRYKRDVQIFFKFEKQT